MRKNTVTSKNRPPQNLTRFPNSRPKYTQTWHHVLKRPQPCINQIKYLHLTTAILLFKLGLTLNSQATSTTRLRLHESAIASRFVFSRKIRDPATFDFCNTIGGKADAPSACSKHH